MDGPATLAWRFGENLIIHRRQADLSQEGLGFRASLHRTEIGVLERGDRLARVDTVIKLAGALSVPPGDLLKGMVWVPGEVSAGRFIAGGLSDAGQVETDG